MGSTLENEQDTFESTPEDEEDMEQFTQSPEDDGLIINTNNDFTSTNKPLNLNLVVTKPTPNLHTKSQKNKHDRFESTSENEENMEEFIESPDDDGLVEITNKDNVDSTETPEDDHIIATTPISTLENEQDTFESSPEDDDIIATTHISTLENEQDTIESTPEDEENIEQFTESSEDDGLIIKTNNDFNSTNKLLNLNLVITKPTPNLHTESQKNKHDTFESTSENEENMEEFTERPDDDSTETPEDDDIIATTPISTLENEQDTFESTPEDDDDIE